MSASSVVVPFDVSGVSPIGKVVTEVPLRPLVSISFLVCDLLLICLVVARFQKDYEKYSAQEREAEAALTEALARLQRIRRLKQEVKEKGDEVFNRGMESLDAWDGVVQQESSAALDAQSVGAVDVLDLSFLDDFLRPGGVPLASGGSSSETHLGPSGSS